MPIGRVAGMLLGVAVAVSGCSTTVSGAPPVGVSLAGSWKVDAAASDDPQKVLDHMREEAWKIIARRQAAQQQAPPPQPGGRGGAGGGRGGAEAPPEEDYTPPPPGTPRGDPLRRSPMAHVVLAFMARGDFLTIRERPGEFVLDFGTSVRSFTPGEHSVVSAEGGVGDQVSGWKGRSYVIQVKGQSGPDVTEELSLSSDGKQLIDKLHIGAEELPAVFLTRIYRPTTEILPHPLPSND